jgi:septal ring factor EnvC (AmiA/AmiB activator)
MLNPARHHRQPLQGLRIAACAVCLALSSFAVLSVAALAQGGERARVEKGQDVAGLAQPDRERLNQSLVETARLIQRGEGLLSSIEARMGELEAQDKLLRGSLAQRHDSIARLLSAMQRMGRNPPPVMITQREDALRMVRSAMMLAAAFPELRGQARELTGRLTELARIMDETRSESEKLKAETARLAESRTRLAELMEVRRQSNAERQADAERARREIAEIAKSVNDLGELIVRLDRNVLGRSGEPPAETAPALAQPTPSPAPSPEPSPPAVAEKPASPPPPAVVAAVPPPTLTPAPPAGRPPAIEIAPGDKATARRDLARIEPAIPFIQTKGRLPLPAQGRRVLAYGDKTQYGSQSKGIVIETRHSAQVTSPTDGWVIFAGEFRTFGQLLIIDARDGYHIMLAGLSRIEVQPRQFVLAGEPVGVMASAPKSVVLKAADSAPVLYIEFRKDNKPIDPDPWWLPDSSQKVQG